MGMLVDGKWEDVWYDTKKSKGHFQRSESQFRNWVTADGAAGPSGDAGFKAEPGRYHLYVSHACPWAHRTMIFRTLKKLEDAISVSVVDYHMGENGWEFRDREGGTKDHIHGFSKLWQVYTAADTRYSGRVTVPVLWDLKESTIVSNESSEIIRMLNSAFDAFGDATLDFYPANLREDIDAINATVYDKVNNGVYKCGFATTQEAYEEHFNALFDTLDMLEKRLGSQRYLVDGRLTEADWRLFTTLIRFDPVYVGHFKCNLRRIADCPHLIGFTRELYQMPGVAATVNMHHIKNHYYGSHGTINPTAIVPIGPEIDYEAPHGRDTLRKAA